MKDEFDTRETGPALQPRWFALALAGLFLAAQLIFAAHAGAGADKLGDHSRDDCPVCMASAFAPDPVDLVVAVDAPSVAFEPVEYVVTSSAQRDGERVRANSRGPPAA